MSRGKFLMVEESLVNLDGHFYDYILTIHEEVIKQGWTVEVAANINVIEQIKSTVNAFPVFQKARFADQGRRQRGDRYFSLILHNWSTLKNLWIFLKKHPSDLAFVPTTLIHHLFAWWFVMKFHQSKPKKLVLLFLNTPAVWSPEKKTSVLPYRARINAMLIALFKRAQRKGEVYLSVQTKSAKREMEELTGLVFELLPQPVNCTQVKLPPDNKDVIYGFFGFTRYEKGCDVFILALKQVLRERPDLNLRFIIQWTSSFQLPDGSVFDLDDEIRGHSRIEIIKHLLTPEEYYQLLSSTDCLILPYRNSSYYSRDSRITIEAVTSGRPVIYTKGGWLNETVDEFGAGIGFEDENAEQLANTIIEMIKKIDFFKREALRKREVARNYFSSAYFVESILRKSN